MPRRDIASKTGLSLRNRLRRILRHVLEDWAYVYYLREDSKWNKLKKQKKNGEEETNEKCKSIHLCYFRLLYRSVYFSFVVCFFHLLSSLFFLSPSSVVTMMRGNINGYYTFLYFFALPLYLLGYFLLLFAFRQCAGRFSFKMKKLT